MNLPKGYTDRYLFFDHSPQSRTGYTQLSGGSRLVAVILSEYGLYDLLLDLFAGSFQIHVVHRLYTGRVQKMAWIDVPGDVCDLHVHVCKSDEERRHGS